MQFSVIKSNSDVLKAELKRSNAGSIDGDEELSQLVSEFLAALAMISVIGICCGFTCVCCIMQSNKRRK